MENIKVLTQILQQYKDLTMNAEKFFYYAYGKFSVKLQGILKNNAYLAKYTEEELVTWLEERDELYCYLEYEELKEFLNTKRIDKYTLSTIKKQIKNQSSIEIIDELNRERTLFLYKEIIFDGEKRRIEIQFNSCVIEMFLKVQCLSYCNIMIKDLKNLNNTYELKLYLYALTIYREQNGAGIIRRSIEDLRVALAENKILQDDNFVSRYLRRPAENINSNNKLSLKLDIKRQKDNILLTVKEK